MKRNCFQFEDKREKHVDTETKYPANNEESSGFELVDSKFLSGVLL